jgi:Tol biopolymer transport system component
MAAVVLAGAIETLAWSAVDAPPPRGSLVIASTRDPMLHDEIWIVNVRTGVRRNFSRSPAGDGDAAVSPDGKAIAFVSDRGGAKAIWVKPTAGGSARRVAGPFGETGSPAPGSLLWSPSGGELGFVLSPRGQIRIVSRRGGADRSLGRRVSSFSWSPDGARLALVSAVAAPFVTILDARGRPVARLPGYYAEWSSRGALAVLGSERTWITDGRGRQVASLAAAGRAQWSPNGRFLALFDARGVRLVTERGRLLLRRSGLGSSAGWAPDSRSLLVSEWGGERLARLRTNGALATVGNGPAMWSPAGGVLTFEGARLVLREGGRARSTQFKAAANVCGGSFVPAGWVDPARVVVTVGLGGQNPADLWVLSSGGRAISRLRSEADWNAGWEASPVWSPDGSRLAYEEREVHTHADSCDAGYQSNVAVVRADGTGGRVLPPAGSVTADPRWSPDGSRIVAERLSFGDENEFGIVVTDADVRAQVRLTTRFGSSPSWSADGTTIVYQHDGSGIRRLPATGGEPTLVARGTSPEASPAAPLVAFIRENALRVIGLDGMGERRLAGLQEAYGAPRWSPDGRQIAVTDAAGIVIVPLADGGLTRIPRPGARSLSWSRDGRQLAFAAPVGVHSGALRSEAFLVSASGGTPRRLTNDLADVGGISWRP